MPKKTQIEHHAAVLAKGSKPDLNSNATRSEKLAFYENSKRRLLAALEEEKAMKYPDEKRIIGLEQKLSDAELGMRKMMAQMNSK